MSVPSAFASEPSTGSLDRFVAAIDVGTNMVRLRVERLAGSWRSLVAHDWVITRLGGGQQQGGPLTAAAMERTVEVLARFAAKTSSLHAPEVWAVATSAVRDASNRDEFVALVKQRTGLDLEVVSGDEEARLDAVGVVADLGGDVRESVLIDIGGGSTELVPIEGGVPLQGVSVPVGVVRLTERYLQSDPPSPAELAALEAAAHTALAEARPAFCEGMSPGCELIANSGTATTLAAVDLGLADFDPDRIRGHVVPRDVVDRIYADLAALPAARRLEVPGVVRGREDLIVSGLALLRAAMDLVRLGRVRISMGGLLEGVLVDRASRIRGEET